MIVFGCDVNLIWAAFLVFDVVILAMGGAFLTCLRRVTPQVVLDIIPYGKTAVENRPSRLVEMMRVPKDNFLHFYVVASLLFPLCWLLCLNAYVVGGGTPEWLSSLLDVVATRQRSSSGIRPESVFLAVTLMTLQVWRRLYECAFVNVPSAAKMNVLHYAAGHLHYPLAAMGIMSQAPAFTPPESVRLHTVRWIHVETSPLNLTGLQIAAVLIYFWAAKHQFVAHKILAQTKLLARGGYGFPEGDWFDRLSCPHYAAEILIYLCVGVILGWRHTTAWILFSWVAVNQTFAALMSHRWYRKQRPNSYDRKKALIPFLL